MISLFGMRAEEPNGDEANLVLHGRDKPKIVAFDVEDDPAALQNARLRICDFHTCSGFRQSAAIAILSHASY